MLTSECLFTFVGHDNWVRGIDVHPTGKCFYSISDDKTLRTWDLNNGKQLKKIDAHDHFITAIASNFHCGIMVTGSVDMSIKVW